MSESEVLKRLEQIENRIDKLTKQVQALTDSAGDFCCEAMASDQLHGTSRKLDEILEILKKDG